MIKSTIGPQAGQVKARCTPIAGTLRVPSGRQRVLIIEWRERALSLMNHAALGDPNRLAPAPGRGDQRRGCVGIGIAPASVREHSCQQSNRCVPAVSKVVSLFETNCDISHRHIELDRSRYEWSDIHSARGDGPLARAQLGDVSDPARCSGVTRQAACQDLRDSRLAEAGHVVARYV